jgi:hypothetical protein
VVRKVLRGIFISTGLLLACHARDLTLSRGHSPALDLHLDAMPLGALNLTIDLDAGDAPIGTPIVVEAYHPEDVKNGQPCETCRPLFSFAPRPLDAAHAHFQLQVARSPEPLRLWIHGGKGATDFGALSDGSALFDEAGERHTLAAARRARLKTL